jgi:transposase
MGVVVVCWQGMGMAMGYRPVDRVQEFLLPPSMVDWLPGDHLVWFVMEAVQRLDTAAFHRRSKLGGVGRQGYDPDMLLTLFVYAMAHGESSSRRVERLCRTDVAFRIICASDVPDHTVLARFRQHHEQALTDLLTESLVLAVELGMVSLGVVGFDGTKIAANASRDANRGEAHLRRLAERFVDVVGQTDEAEDALFGEDNRGDELPEGVSDRSGRGGRISQALEQIQQRRRAADEARRERVEHARGYERDAAVPGVARRGRAPRDVDPVAVAKARWERERAKAQARYAAKMQARAEKTRSGCDPVPPDEFCYVRKARAAHLAAQARAAARAGETDRLDDPDVVDHNDTDRFKANLTDPQSRLLKTRNGWIQGYNCQTAASDDGFIVSARATQDPNDIDQFVPTMGDIIITAQQLADRTGRDDLTIGTMVGDAGYDSVDNLTADGPDRLIADGKRRDIDHRATDDPADGDPPADASPRERMNHRLRTAEGHALYKRRAAIIEAPNAWLKDRRGLRRFSRRGLSAVQSELALASAVTNLLKLASNGITTGHLKTG